MKRIMIVLAISIGCVHAMYVTRQARQPVAQAVRGVRSAYKPVISRSYSTLYTPSVSTISPQTSFLKNEASTPMPSSLGFLARMKSSAKQWFNTGKNVEVEQARVYYSQMRKAPSVEALKDIIASIPSRLINTPEGSKDGISTITFLKLAIELTSDASVEVQKEIIGSLLEKEANPQLDPQERSGLPYVLNKNYQGTPLTVAIRQGNVGAVEKLLSSYEIGAAYLKEARHYSLLHRNKERYQEVYKLLLKAWQEKHPRNQGLESILRD